MEIEKLEGTCSMGELVGVPCIETLLDITRKELKLLKKDRMKCLIFNTNIKLNFWYRLKFRLLTGFKLVNTYQGWSKISKVYTYVANF